MCKIVLVRDKLMYANRNFERIFVKLIFTISCVAVHFSAFSADDWIQENYITGYLSSGNFPVRKFQPSTTHSQLVFKKLTELDEKIATEITSNFQKSSFNLSLLLIENGEIVLELYKPGLSSKNKFFSYSMSKSLTAETVGYALCNGFLTSLNERAGDISDSLKGNVFGLATVEQLLTMNSGARPPDQEGGSLSGEWNEVTRGISSITEILNRYGKDQKNAGNFVYNNSDTNALMLAIEGRTNFGDLFEKNIWIKSMPESEATWLLDKNKKIYAAAGFGATLRDWGRLATHALAMRNGSEGACIESYMRNATRLLVTDNQKKRYFGYGYQTWISPVQRSEIFLWQGAYGQKVIFDPRQNKIMILFRNKEEENILKDFFMSFHKWRGFN